MKTPNSNIFWLIRRMTASEKRYFKIHFASEKSLMTDLFDFINSLKTYDERVIKQHFATSKLSKNLKVYKVQLRDLILKSLNIYHYKRSVPQKIKAELNEIDLLLYRQLFELAKDKLKRLKAFCKNNEQFNFLLIVIRIELQLENYGEQGKKGELLDELLTYENILHHTSQYQRQMDRLELLLQDLSVRSLSATERQKYQSLLEDYKAKNKLPSSAFEENCYLQMTIAALHRILGQTQEELIIRKNNLQTFNDKLVFQKLKPYLYWKNLHAYLEVAISHQAFEEVTTYLETAKRHLDQYPQFNYNYLFIFYLELLAAFKQQALSTIPALEQQLLQHISSYKQEHHLVSLQAYLLLSLVYLQLEQPKKVYAYLRRLHQAAKKQANVYARLGDVIELISHYETGDELVIQHLIASHKRKRYYHKSSATSFDKWMTFFKQLLKLPSEDRPMIAQLFLQELATFEAADLSHLLLRVIADDWLNAVIKSQAYAAYMRSKAAVFVHR